MGFKQKNSHARWVSYRDKNPELFERLIEDKLANLKEKDFALYLINGFQNKFRFAINELTNEDFLALEKIVNGWFDFQDFFDSFYAERIKRFNRYG